MPTQLTSPNFNFSLVVNRLYNSLKSGEANGRANFLRILFESFYDNPLFDRHPGDQILREYFNGYKNIPKPIINYYAIPANQKALKKTISEKILPKTTDPSLVATNLFNLLKSDTYFLPFEKAHILENKDYCNNDDSIASLITEMILLSFKCKKSKITKKDSPKSPSLKNELIAPPPPPL